MEVLVAKMNRWGDRVGGSWGRRDGRGGRTGGGLGDDGSSGCGWRG